MLNILLMKTALIFLFCHFLCARGTHFRGGTLSWKAESASRIYSIDVSPWQSAIFNFNVALQNADRCSTFAKGSHLVLGWELGRGGCDSQKKGTYVTSLASEKWRCTRGCTGQPAIGDNSYFCTGTDQSEGWEQGEKRFTYSFTGQGPFTVGYSGRNWMPLSYGVSGLWNLESMVYLRPRSDTGVPNNSPVTASLPVYLLAFGCTTTITIPVYDEDGDVIRCRWSRGTECGSICSNGPSLPSAKLDEASCTLTITPTVVNNYAVNGYYAVALTIEDFPKRKLSLNGVVVSTKTALSSIPLQFLIKPVQLRPACSRAPVFLDAPPDRTAFISPDGQIWSQRIYIQAQGGSLPDSITVSGPRNLNSSSLQPDDRGRGGVKFVDLAWAPTPAEKGVHMLCLRAFDQNKMPSEQRCFTLLAGAPDPCNSGPCFYGGTCSLHYDSFRCACPKGVKGNQCEIDVNECLLSPCTNGGVCSNTVGSYQCFCSQGFTGQNCSEVDLCAANPCKGQGHCNQTGSVYTCSCFSGYTGVHCETDINDCASQPCLHGGRCRDMVTDYLCDCPINYGGKNCEQAVELCVPSPCRNGANCESFSDSYVCHCEDGFSGLNCEQADNKACDADDSYCTCMVNGKPARVTIPPQSLIDESREDDLIAGIIGYPIGLALGAIGCALYHYLVRQRCLRGGSYQPRPRPSSSSSTTPLGQPETPVTPTGINPNIYRSGFNDDMIFKTGEKMNVNTYMSGQRDW